MKFDLLSGKFSSAEARQLNPLVLAYIGDAVYEVFIRTYCIELNRDMLVHKLHKKVVSFVKAHSQSEFMKGIEELLTEDEMGIFKRGRNTKSSVPKNADVQEYRMATGFEAVIGYLYITEQSERLNYILNEVIRINTEREQGESK